MAGRQKSVGALRRDALFNLPLDSGTGSFSSSSHILCEEVQSRWTFSEENNKISSDVDADNSSKSFDSTDLYPSLKPKKRKTKGDFHCGGCIDCVSCSSNYRELADRALRLDLNVNVSTETVRLCMFALFVYCCCCCCCC
jgi:hypothetical protein